MFKNVMGFTIEVLDEAIDYCLQRGKTTLAELYIDTKNKSTLKHKTLFYVMYTSFLCAYIIARVQDGFYEVERCVKYRLRRW
jgi:hypothetical protein